MGTCTLNSLDNVRALVELAQTSDRPLAVLDGDDECLVVMRPAVFERILFDTERLNHTNRDAFGL